MAVRVNRWNSAGALAAYRPETAQTAQTQPRHLDRQRPHDGELPVRAPPALIMSGRALGAAYPQPQKICPFAEAVTPS